MNLNERGKNNRLAVVCTADPSRQATVQKPFGKLFSVHFPRASSSIFISSNRRSSTGVFRHRQQQPAPKKFKDSSQLCPRHLPLHREMIITTQNLTIKLFYVCKAPFLFVFTATHLHTHIHTHIQLASSQRVI
jgi:hypothetical protein